MDKRKVLIDTDPGIDDGFAILTALNSKEFDVLGIMCVAGNKSLPIVTPNALRLVDFMKMDVPVVKGAKACLDKLHLPDEQENLSADCHGIDGMGESGLPYTERCLLDIPAWDFMLDKIRQYPNEIELVALGPLTNLAVAIQKDIETMKKLKSITIMGGAFNHKGNTTDYAEYNIWFDAKAASFVVENLADHVPMKFVGLDATHGTVLSHDVMDFLSYEGGEMGQLLERISRPYIKSYYDMTRVIGAIIHDLYTVLSLIDPSIINKEEQVKCKIYLDEVHRGQTAIDEDGKFVTAVMDFDDEKLKRLFLNTLMPGKAELIEEFLPQL